jgi:putative transcriptional regulator
MVGEKIKFKKNVVSKVKELREERNMSQEELANKIGVSRQTIYYLEKGQYNPKLTLSFSISSLFNKPIEEIFSPEPIIKEILGNKTLDELEDLSRETEINLERLIELKNLNENKLSEKFDIKELEGISKALGKNFDDFFIISE